MGRKNKVEISEHREEIHTKLLQGDSCRSISKYLKDTYDEDIGYGAIYSYSKKHIKIEEEISQRVNEKLAAENEKAIEKEVNTQVNIHQKNDAVIEVNAENMIGVMKVAGQLNDEFEKACDEAADPTCNTTHKDTAKIALDANKVVNDFYKTQENNIELNLDNNLSGFVDESEVMRFIDESEDEESNSK